MENKEKNTRIRLRTKTNHDICEENQLKDGMLLTNIVDEKITKNKIRATLQIIAKALSGTLGPDGSTTILQDSQRQHLVTKDGLDVINRMSFQDDIAKTILDLVKTISLNQVLAVGDGSTSAVIVANSLYQEFTSPENDEYFKYTSPKVIVEILNYLSDYLEKKLKESAQPLSEDLHELVHIAAVAMNNDSEVGELVKDIYAKIGKDGFISTDITQNNEKDLVEYKHGISWNRGFIDPFFAEKYEGRKIIHEKPAIFITTTPVTMDDVDTIYRPLIGQICSKEKRELIIIANYISDEAKNFFKNVRETYKLGRPELFFTPVDIEQITEISKNNLKDLALLCGCEIYNKNIHTVSDLTVRLDPAYKLSDHPDKYRFIGNALRGTITKNNTEIICDDSLLNDTEIANKKLELSKIYSELTTLDNKSKLNNEEIQYQFTLKTRKANLENLSAILHVGGKTYEERRSRERLLEDSIYAGRSAMKYGYVVGGNIMIPRILEHNCDTLATALKEKFSYLNQKKDFFKFFIILLRDSFLESYRAVLENSQILTDENIDNILDTVLYKQKFYNLKTHRYEAFNETNVINSVDTDLQIMKSCISLMSLIATSNQIITLNYNLVDQVR